MGKYSRNVSFLSKVVYIDEFGVWLVRIKLKY